jgi:hypothetical protein
VLAGLLGGLAGATKASDFELVSDIAVSGGGSHQISPSFEVWPTDSGGVAADTANHVVVMAYFSASAVKGLGPFHPDLVNLTILGQGLKVAVNRRQRDTLPGLGQFKVEGLG